MVNIYTAYGINLWSFWVGKDTLENYLFGAVKLTKNTDPEKNKYPGYGVRFDARGSFLLSDGSWIGKNKVILASYLCSSLQIDNTTTKKKKNHISRYKSNRWFRYYIDCRDSINYLFYKFY